MGGSGWVLLLVASVAAGAVGGAISEWASGRLWLRRHRHAHQPIAVSPVDGLAGFGHPSSDVLVRCGGCGDVRTITLAGRWTLSQVQGLGELGDVADAQADPAEDPATVGGHG